MLEGEFNRKLKKALEKRLPGCVVIKHCNPYYGGIPDFSVSNGSKTLWIEVKMKGNHCTPLQMNTLMRFGEAAFQVIADKDGKNAKFLRDRNSRCSYMPFEMVVNEIARSVGG